MEICESSKRQNTREESGESMSKTTEISRIPSGEYCKSDQDLISELPNCVIYHILSFLDTKDAVRTSVLSKDWEHKWTFIPKYVLNDGYPSNKPSFASFVERTLLLSNNLQIFALCCDGEYDLLPWIATALSRNLRSLWIEGQTSNFVLSRELLTCYSLRELLLDNFSCTLKVHEKLCFPNLTKLVLRICISNEHSNSDRVEFSLPLLEKLELTHCEWLNTKFVEIYAPKMTHLELMRPVYAPDDCSLKIIGDNLVNLQWYEVSAVNHIGISHVILSGLAHVVYASLEHYFGGDDEMGEDDLFFERSGLQLRKVLKGFSNLKDFELGGDVTDVIAISKLRLSLPMYYKLERLVLKNWIYSDALLELLHSTPHLKLLGISLGDLEEYDYEAEASVPHCIVSHLEKVMITSFTGKMSQINLIKFFLNQASQLKSLLVILPSKNFEKERRVVVEELSTHPKASTCLKLIVDNWSTRDFRLLTK